MLSDSLEVVVFSYNRGKLLYNCVSSIRKYMPDTSITVFDDGSDDRETITVLKDIKRNGWARILISHDNLGVNRAPSTKCGGLSRNMQLFLDVYGNSEWILFLQDDMQVIREFTAFDKETLQSIYWEYPSSVFIYPAFITKSLYDCVDPDSIREGSSSFSFLYDYDYSGFFDVCIIHLGRLRKVGWKFENELVDSLTAREKFGVMRLMRQPFVAHLPSPPTHHYNGKTIAASIWEYFRADCYPIDPLSNSDLRQLFSYMDTFPKAEDYLSSSSFWGSHPWPLSKLEGAPLYFKVLDKLERGARNRLARFI